MPSREFYPIIIVKNLINKTANIIVKKLNSLKHLVRTTVAESHN